MNLKRLQSKLPQATVTRQRRREIRVQAGKLDYRFDTRRFKNERELADYAASKLPVATFMAGNNQ